MCRKKFFKFSGKQMCLKKIELCILENLFQIFQNTFMYRKTFLQYSLHKCVLENLKFVFRKTNFKFFKIKMFLKNSNFVYQKSFFKFSKTQMCYKKFELCVLEIFFKSFLIHIYVLKFFFKSLCTETHLCTENFFKKFS